MTSLPSELTTTPEVASVMDVDEARERTEAIRGGVSQIRGHLLAIYLGRGWESLGYNSFNDYLSSEFSISRPYLWRQTHAALLESELSESDELVGKHRESHLRPLNSILGDDTGAKALAYYTTLDRVDSPVAQDFQRVAAEIYIHTSGDDRVLSRYKSGQLGVMVAYELCKWVEKFQKSGDYDLLVVSRECSDVDLIPIFERLKKRQAQTWSEIYHSGTVPAFPDPIPIEKATTYNLLAWLDVASAEHRAIARMVRQSHWDERKAAIDEVLKGVATLLGATDIKSRAEAEVGLRSAYQRYENVKAEKDNSHSEKPEGVLV